jgi:hypothetical protein
MDETKKILLNVDIENVEAIKRLADTKARMADLRLEQKNLDVSTDSGKQKFEILGQQIKALNTDSLTYQKTIQSNVKSQNEESTSIQGLKALLSLQTAEYNKMSSAMRDTTAGKAMQASIKGTSDSLKKLEKDLGDNHREVGNYGTALGTLPGIFGEMQAKGQSVLVALRTRFESTKDMVMQYSEAVNVSKVAQGEAAVAAQAATVAESELAAAEAAGTATASQAAAAEALRGTATATATVATEASTAAMKIFKIALASTGIGLLVVALGAVVAYFTQTNEGSKLFSRLMSGINAVIQTGVKILGSYGKLLVDIVTLNFKEVGKDVGVLVDNVKNAGTEMGKTYEAGRKITDDRQKLTKAEREWSTEKIRQQGIMDTLALKIRQSDTSAVERKKAEAEASKIRETIFKRDIQYAKENLRIVNEEQALKSKKDYQAIADAKNRVEQTIAEDNKYEQSLKNRVGRVNNMIGKNSESRIKTEITTTEKLLSERGKSLDALEKSTLISEDVYNARIKQVKDLQDEELTLLNKKAIAEKMSDNAVLIAKENINQASLKRQKDLITERTNLLITASQYEMTLERSQSDEIIAGKKQTIEQLYFLELVRIKQDRDEQIKEQNLKLSADPLYQAEHDKQIALITQQSRTKEAQANFAFDEKERQRKLDTAQIDLNNKLELVQGNIDLEYSLKLEALEAQRKAEILAAESSGASILLINAKFNKLESDSENEKFQRKFENIKKWADESMKILTAGNNLSKAIEAGQLQDAEESNSTKTKDLDDRLAKGLITQKVHDDGVAASAAELDKKKAKIAHDQAVRDKALNIMSVIINTAAAIMAQLKIGPAGIPLAIAAGVTGALELATIIATPVPKASRGLLLKGKSHAQGGIPIEAEGGEAIINKRSTSLFGPILSAMNVAGGGDAFSNQPYIIPDGGYAVRQAISSGNGITGAEMNEIMKQLKVYSTIQDIRKADVNYSKIEDRGSF